MAEFFQRRHFVLEGHRLADVGRIDLEQRFGVLQRGKTQGQIPVAPKNALECVHVCSSWPVPHGQTLSPPLRSSRLLEMPPSRSRLHARVVSSKHFGGRRACTPRKPSKACILKFVENALERCPPMLTNARMPRKRTAKSLPIHYLQHTERLPEHARLSDGQPGVFESGGRRQNVCRPAPVLSKAASSGQVRKRTHERLRSHTVRPRGIPTL